MASERFGNYYYIDVKAAAEIGGRRYPLVSLIISYGIGELPSAHIELPIGRSAGGPTLGLTSEAIGLLTSIKPFTPVSVFATLTPTPAGRAAPAGKDRGFPAGKEFMIFDGFVKKPAASRSFGSAALAFDCMGFAAALAGSTQLTAGTAISTVPNGASIITAYLGADQAGAATIEDAIILNSGGDPSSDLWADAILPIFEDIASSTNDWSGRENNFSEQALERINLEGGALPALPLGLDQDVPVELFNKSLAVTLSHFIWSRWAAADFTGDLWSTLLDLAPLFGFKYITAINEDSVAPMFFGLKADPHRIIDPSEYDSIDMGTEYDEKFYSYVTEVGLVSGSFQSSPWQQSVAKAIAVGSFDIDPLLLGDKTEGRLQLIPAPVWLLPFGAPGKSSLNPGGAVPDAGNPEDTGAEPEDQGEAENVYFGSGIGDDYAETVLRDMLFAHRVVRLRGRLRFDIAPGSLLQVNTAGERFTGVKDTLFGHVVRTTISIGESAGGSYAYTSFDIGAVRTSSEHNSALTVEEHPLFGEAWIGGRLTAEE